MPIGHRSDLENDSAFRPDFYEVEQAGGDVPVQLLIVQQVPRFFQTFGNSEPGMLCRSDEIPRVVNCRSSQPQAPRHQFRDMNRPLSRCGPLYLLDFGSLFDLHLALKEAWNRAGDDLQQE